ncbi:MAG: acyl-CoA dehydrogenase family protein [Proteobacteria bacterium]|nr:acyl-CoA dehydrogenase family protein [Pseudomonadota bacterium]
MDLSLGPNYQNLRRDVEEWLTANWPLRGDEAALPEAEQASQFRRRAVAAGYLARSVPQEYGGAGLEPDILAETVIREAMTASRAPWRTSGPQGVDMLVPTLLEEGTPEQCRRYIPDTLSGDLVWCQGYSEPGAGSDLASLQARAELRGDSWVLNGQKIWTSNAHEAHMMFGLFRTEPEAPRSKGISYLLIPMDASGIDVRPLRAMSGGIDFCEVFFDDVHIPAGNIVGERGQGWRVSKATLKHERMAIGDHSYLERSFEAVLALARRQMRGGRPAIGDPHVRQRLAELEGFVAAQRCCSYRMISALARHQDAKVVGDMLMTKLHLTDALQRIAKLAADLLEEHGADAPGAGEGGVVTGWETPGMWSAQYMLSLGLAIAGGTSNVQRNIIGERLLGLPRDPRP